MIFKYMIFHDLSQEIITISMSGMDAIWGNIYTVLRIRNHTQQIYSYITYGKLRNDTPDSISSLYTDYHDYV